MAVTDRSSGGSRGGGLLGKTLPPVSLPSTQGGEVELRGIEAPQVRVFGVSIQATATNGPLSGASACPFPC